MRRAAASRSTSSRIGSGMLFLLGLGLLVLVAVIVLKWAPGWLATGGLNGRDEAEEVGRTRTAILAALAGVIAVVGAVFTGLSYRLNRAGQVTERFTRAVDQLGGERLEVRLGGIYALERIARDSKHDHPQVVELLSAFVREHAALSAALGPAHPPARTDRPRSALPADVQAALTVLGRRNVNYDRVIVPSVNLAYTDLRGAVLIDAHFERGGFRGACLQGAPGSSCRRAHFEDAHFREAHLENAGLSEAHFQHANLRDAHLEGAHLDGADLRGADCRGARLDEADLRGARFDGADLRYASTRSIVRNPEDPPLPT